MGKELEKNFYYFLNKYGYLKDKEVNTKNKKEEYYEILFELVDTSKDKVQCLTKEQTKLLRDFLGLHRNVPTLTELAKESNVSINTITKRLSSTAYTLKKRIIRGCVSLEENTRLGLITRKELLNTPLYAVDYSDKLTIEKILNSKGYEITLEEITNLEADVIAKTYRLSKQGFDGFIDYIHSLGLTFKDEVSALESVDLTKIEPKKVEVKEEFSEAYNSLLTELKRIEEKETSCDKIIEEQLNKKQELIELRKNIAKIANQISELSNDEFGFRR